MFYEPPVLAPIVSFNMTFLAVSMDLSIVKTLVTLENEDMVKFMVCSIKVSYPYIHRNQCFVGEEGICYKLFFF